VSRKQTAKKHSSRKQPAKKAAKKGAPTEKKKSPTPAKKKSKLEMEALESRILLSGTWVDAATGAALGGATSGADTFTGTSGIDFADGQGGDDHLIGAGGSDILSGGSGNDLLEGGSGNDVLSGGSGDDILRGGTGINIMDGGSGTDVIDYSDVTVPLKVTIAGTSATITGAGIADVATGFEEVVGSAASDTFTITSPTAGAVYSIDGGGGRNDLLKLTTYSSSQATFLKDSLVVNMGGGNSFTVDYENIDSIQFSDLTLLTGGSQAALEGDTVALTPPTAALGGIRTYTWTQLSGPAVTLSSANTSSPTFTAPEMDSDESLVFKVQMTVGGITTTTLVTVDVGEELSADAGTDQSVNEGASVTLDAAGSDWASSEVFSEVSRLLPSDGAAGDVSGFSVSVDGTLAAVSAHNSDSGASNNGAVYLFEKSGDSWTQAAKLVPTDAEPNRFFGFSVDVSGNNVLVGAIGEDDAGLRSGAAYVFSKVNGSWTQAAKLTAPDGAAGDLFGAKVSISGNVAVVGASQDDDGGTNSGSAHVYEFNGTTWNHMAKLNAADPTADGLFGHQVSVSGNSIIVGSQGHTGLGLSSGAAYIFEKTGGVWAQTAKLAPATAGLAGFFGSSVAISGDTAVVGSATERQFGAAYVYQKTGGAWQQVSRLTASDFNVQDRFGAAVDISGDRIVVGAFLDDQAGSNSGAAYVFKKDAGTWTELTKITSSTAGVADQFGMGVAVSGGTVIVGSPFDDDSGSNSGSATTFSGSQSNMTYSWSQTGGPAVTLSSASAQKPSFTAPEGLSNSTLTFQVTVSDGIHTSVDTVNVLVNADNDAPTARAGADQTVNEGAVVSLSGAASTDPEAQGLTYQWSQTAGPTVALSSSTAVAPTFTAPEGLSNTSVTFQLTVSDGVNTSVDSVTIAINRDNDAPAANAGADQTVDEGTLVSLSASGSSDPEGQGLTYQWVQTSGPTVTLSSGSSASPTFTAPQGLLNTSVTFQLTVSDGVNTSIDSVTIAINSDNDAPAANAGADQTVDEGALVSLSASGSSDPEGQGLTYQWVQTAGPAVVLSSSTSSSPSFVAPNGISNTSVTFQLTVSDGANTSVDTVTVAINCDDDAPAVDAGADQRVAPTTRVTLAATASDPENQGLTYTWTQISGTAVALTNANTATARFSAPAVASPTTLVFQVAVSDGVNTSLDTVSIIISP